MMRGSMRKHLPPATFGFLLLAATTSAAPPEPLALINANVVDVRRAA